MTNPYETLKTFKEKQQILRSLSKQIKPLATMTGLTVNEGLILHYFGSTEAKVNTYKGWMEQGYKVKKGEKGWAIWSRPVKSKKEDENQEEKDLFRVAYVFHSSQVEAIN